MSTAEQPAAPLKVEKKVGIFRRMWAGLSILFASKIATVGLAIVLFWVIVAVFAPLSTSSCPSLIRGWGRR